MTYYVGARINFLTQRCWPRQTWAISGDTFDRYSDLNVNITSCLYLELELIFIDKVINRFKIKELTNIFDVWASSILYYIIEPFEDALTIYIETCTLHLYDESSSVSIFRPERLSAWMTRVYRCCVLTSRKTSRVIVSTASEQPRPLFPAMWENLYQNHEVISYLFCLRIAVALCFARGSANPRRVIHITKWNAKWNFMKCLNTR